MIAVGTWVEGSSSCFSEDAATTPNTRIATVTSPTINRLARLSLVSEIIFPWFLPARSRRTAGELRRRSSGERPAGSRVVRPETDVEAGSHRSHSVQGTLRGDVLECPDFGGVFPRLEGQA